MGTGQSTSGTSAGNNLVAVINHFNLENAGKQGREITRNKRSLPGSCPVGSGIFFTSFQCIFLNRIWADTGRKHTGSVQLKKNICFKFQLSGDS